METLQSGLQEDLYDGKTFSNGVEGKKGELSFLQRLQTLGRINNLVWDRAKHFPRLQKLEKELLPQPYKSLYQTNEYPRN